MEYGTYTLLVITWYLYIPLFGMEKERLETVQHTTRSRSNTSLFMDFVRNNKFFSESDENLIQNSLHKLKNKNPQLHQELCVFLNEAASEKKDEKAELRITQELLFQLKNEQYMRLQQMQHDHQEERVKSKTARCHFWISTTIAIVVGCASILEAVLLIVNQGKCS